MIANYHTHTSRCRHATGIDEDYIRKAIAEGLKILGFSDHAPYIYPNGYDSYYKMRPCEAAEYFESILRLKKKYEDKIEIYVGYESEYYADLWDDTFNFWKEGNRPDYLLLGQHHVNNEYDVSARVHCATGSDRPEFLTEYVDSIIAGIKTGCFTYIAHPDLFNYLGSKDFYFEEISRLMTAVKAADMPIEINLLGIQEGRRYPSEDFWRFASEYSPKVVLGCDAHDPNDVAREAEITRAIRLADKYKLEILETLPLVDPFG